MYDGACPKCGRKLSIIPLKIEVKPAPKRNRHFPCGKHTLKYVPLDKILPVTGGNEGNTTAPVDYEGDILSEP